VQARYQKEAGKTVRDRTSYTARRKVSIELGTFTSLDVAETRGGYRKKKNGKSPDLGMEKEKKKRDSHLRID